MKAWKIICASKRACRRLSSKEELCLTKFIGFELEKNFFDIAKKRIDEAIVKREQSLF